MDEFIQKFNTVFNPEIILKKISNALPEVLIAIIILIFFLLIWFGLKKVLTIFIKRTHMDLTAASFLQTILKYSLLIIGVISSLNQIGVNVTSILTSLGILGLTIGFAAKDALSNIISGIFIFWDRPFVINDLIEIEDQYGRVDLITLRSTRIVTVDGKMLAIPNTYIVNKIVSSYTNFPHLRIEVSIAVSMNENIAKIRSLLVGLVEKDKNYMDKPEPEVVVESLNDYNILIKLRAWIFDERKNIPLRYELREKAFNVLFEAGVNMPYETIQLAPFKSETKIVDETKN